MKKPLIIAITSITVVFILMFQLYEHTEIIDDIVEPIAKITGIGKEMVERKIERKAKEAEDAKAEEVQANQNKENELAQALAQKQRLEELNKNRKDSVKRADSILLAKANKKKKLFNSSVDTAQLLAMTTKLEDRKVEPVKKKKSLFNSSSEEPEQIKTEGISSKEKVQFFTAKIHGVQKFNNNDEVTFRLAQKVNLNGNLIPENVVFKAKANVFDEKIYFIVKTIHDTPIQAENYGTEGKGIAIKTDYYIKGGYLLSDGLEMKFGYVN
jgi:hypothetical protein